MNTLHIRQTMPRLAAKPRRVVTTTRRAVVPVKRKPRLATRVQYVAPPASTRVSKTRSQAGGAFRSGGSTLGGMLGTALGGPAGGALGGMLGRGAGAMFSKLLGHGDYGVTNAASLSKNSIVLSNSANIPQFGTGKVACNFRHREFLGDVISSGTVGAFQIETYPINPGLSKTFPWLSGVVGSKFQQYRINGCAFEFRSMSADALNSTNTALGSVIMSTDYDSADTDFASKQEMENTENGVSCKPSTDMLHGIECERSQTPVSELYVRAFDVPSGKDIRFYDLGKFSIATVGCQGTNVNLGELWCTYDIDCFKAIEQVPGYLIPFSQYSLTAQSATAPLGTSRTQLITTAGTAPNCISLTIGENKIEWDNVPQYGTVYRVHLDVLADEKGLTTPAVTSGNGMYINIDTFLKTASATATKNLIVSFDVQYQGGGSEAKLPYVNIADYTWAVTVVDAQLYVYQMPGLFPGRYTSQSNGLDEDDDPGDTDQAPGYISVQEEEKRPRTALQVRRRA